MAETSDGNGLTVKRCHLFWVQGIDEEQTDQTKRISNGSNKFLKIYRTSVQSSVHWSHLHHTDMSTKTRFYFSFFCNFLRCIGCFMLHILPNFKRYSFFVQKKKKIAGIWRAPIFYYFCTDAVSSCEYDLPYCVLCFVYFLFIDEKIKTKK